MAALSPEVALSTSNLPLGGIVTVAPSSATNLPHLQEQVLLTVHPINDVGVNEEGKSIFYFSLFCV